MRAGVCVTGVGSRPPSGQKQIFRTTPELVVDSSAPNKAAGPDSGCPAKVQPASLTGRTQHGALDWLGLG